MTTLEAVTGATLVFGAIVGASRFKPGRDSWLKLALIVTLATAGGWLMIGQYAAEAARNAEEMRR